MTNQVIETVEFKLASGISDEDFIKTSPPLSDFLKSCDGFIRRRLSKGEDGCWLEHVEWETLVAAKAASELFMKQETLAPYMQSIDMQSVKMQHQQLVISTE